jgi:hypothetical protein
MLDLARLYIKGEHVKQNFDKVLKLLNQINTKWFTIYPPRSSELDDYILFESLNIVPQYEYSTSI